MEYSYRFRLYPTEAQEELMAKTFGCCRYVFNRFLDRRKTAYKETGTGLSYKECSKELTALKKELPWLKEVDATALQASLKNLDRAYKNFFTGLKAGRRVGYPQFKAKKRDIPSFKATNNKGTALSWDTVSVSRKSAMWIAASVSRSMEKSFLRLYSKPKAANTMLLSTARM